MSSPPPPPAGIDPATWNAILHIRTGCFPTLVPQIKNDYGYQPSLGAGIAFDVLFGLALIGHIIQAIRFRRWTSTLFAIGALSTLFTLSSPTVISTIAAAKRVILLQPKR